MDVILRAQMDEKSENAYVSIVVEPFTVSKLTKGSIASKISKSEYTKVKNLAASAVQRNEFAHPGGPEAALKNIGEQLAGLLDIADSTSYSRYSTQSTAEEAKRSASIREGHESQMTPLAFLSEAIVQSRTLNLLVDCNSPEIEELPWELLVVDGDHVSLLENVRLVRTCKSSSQPNIGDGTVDLRVLNVNMSNTTLVKRTTKPTQYPDITAKDPPNDLTVRSLDTSNITWPNITAALREEQYTVFQFSGHGDLTDDGTAVLCVSSDECASGGDQGGPTVAYYAAEVKAYQVAAAVKETTDLTAKAILVLLSCCHAGIGKDWSGFGVELLTQGVPVVVSMQTVIQDAAANAFADSLYNNLDNAHSIASAVAAARRDLKNLDDKLPSLDWWVPVLHTNNFNLILETKKRIDNLSPTTDKNNADAARVDEATSGGANALNDESGGAVSIIQELLRSETARSGAGQLATLATYEKLALMLRREMRINEALAIERDIVSVQEATLDELEMSILTIRRRMAGTLFDMGKLNEALRIQTDMLTEQERKSGADHPTTLEIRQSCAATLRRLGQLHEALKLEREVLRNKERLLGTDHAATLSARQSLAVTLYVLGDLDAALELETSVLNARQRILGAADPATLDIRRNRATTLRRLGRLDEALAIQKEVLRISEDELGKDHPATMDACQSLAITYYDLGQLEEALKLETRVLNHRERELGPDHRATLEIRENRAETLCALGQVEEALAIQTDVLTDMERQLGKDHPSTLSVRQFMAVTLRSMGRLDDALAIQEKLSSDVSRVLGDEHPTSFEVRQDQAETLRSMGRLDEALAIQEKVLAKMSTVLDDDHPYTKLAREKLTEMQIQFRRIDEARYIESEARPPSD